MFSSDSLTRKEEEMLHVLTKAVQETLTATLGRTPERDIKLDDAPLGKGDYSFCVTPFAKDFGKDPLVLVQEVANMLKGNNLIDAVVISGPFVNMTISAKPFFAAACETAQQKAPQVEKSERIMVEYLSPNTNKPLHLGHVRNGVLGSSLANILEAVGHTVVRANLVNDRGVHICKSMIGYNQFFSDKTPQSVGMKGDHFVGDCYVAYAKWKKQDPAYDPDNDTEAKALLSRWEAGELGVLTQWEMMNSWVYEGFEATYARYGFVFEKIYYESQLYRLGKDIVSDGLARGVFERHADGSIVFRLSLEKHGTDPDGTERIAGLLRPEGTSLYLTQDLGTAVRKAEDYSLDRSIYVVACEQNHHFRVLFDILEALGYPWAKNCYHFSYEMVELPEGRMKSREGTVVDADDLADEMTLLAKDAIKKRQSGELSEEEITHRANIIGLAAIKLYLLRFNPQKKVVFDPKRSLSFEGDTGPYCLYTLARIRGIVDKARSVGASPIEMTQGRIFENLGSEEERMIARDLLNFPQAIARAAESYTPSIVADRVLSLARNFNRFYKDHPVVTSDRNLTEERLTLCVATDKTIRWGLSLLGIETLDAM